MKKLNFRDIDILKELNTLINKGSLKEEDGKNGKVKKGNRSII